MKKVSGIPLPLGVTYKNGRANFAMEVPEGKTCKLLLYRKGEASLLASYVFSDRIGSVCYMAVDGLKEEAYEYNYDIDGECMTDSYAKAFSGKEIWLKNIGISEKSKENVRGIFYEDHYDWEADQSPRIQEEELIAYAIHVRGFTKDTYSKVKNKGTFQGVIEKIPYLKDLGINQIQCMPVYEFEEAGVRVNYWGYGPGYYFAPKSAYAKDGDGVKGLKDLVKYCHKAGIEVVLEMPFAEGISGLMVTDCLRNYVMEYHVDGFILNPYNVPMDIILKDPILTGVRILKHAEEYQNVMRRFLKGDEGVVTDVMYQTRKRWDLEGIYNCITTHTGFTLKDLVSYDGKHNEANGENNQDGPKQLIKFRKKYRLFHQEKELLGIDRSGCGMPDVSYHGEMAWRASTEVASRQIGIYYSSQDKEEADCFVAYNMHWLEHEFALPALKKGRKWYRAASTKEGILKDLVVLENQRNIELDEREIVVLVSGKGETV